MHFLILFLVMIPELFCLERSVFAGKTSASEVAGIEVQAQGVEAKAADLGCENTSKPRVALPNGDAFSTSLGDPSVTIPLVDLLAQTADLDPKKRPLTNLQSLSHLLQSAGPVSDARKKRLAHQLRILKENQFDDESVISALITNSLDAHAYAENEQKGGRASEGRAHNRVSVTSSKEGELSIHDDGIGMDLNDLVFYLLTPNRSRNRAILHPEQATPHVAGRSGRNFFSVLPYLEQKGDEVIVNTRTSKGEPFRLSLFLNAEDRIMARIEAGDRQQSGADILIRSSKLESKYAKGGVLREALAHEVASSKFRYSNRGRIEIDGEALQDFESKNATHFQVGSGSVRVLDAEPVNGHGKITLTRHGQVIQEIPLEGSNIYSHLVIDVPEFGEVDDRVGLDFWDERSRQFIKSIVDEAVKRNDVTLVNTLYPLLSQDGFRLVPDLDLSFEIDVVPALPEVLDLQAVNGKPVALLHPDIYNYAKSIKTLESLAGHPGETVLVVSRTTQLKPKFRVVTARGRQLVFVNEKVDLNGPMVKHILNEIHASKAKVLKAGFHEEPLFHAPDPERETKSEAKLLERKGDVPDLKGVPDLKTALATYNRLYRYDSEKAFAKKHPNLSARIYELALEHYQSNKAIAPEVSFDKYFEIFSFAASEVFERPEFQGSEEAKNDVTERQLRKLELLLPLLAKFIPVLEKIERKEVTPRSSYARAYDVYGMASSRYTFRWSPFGTTIDSKDKYANYEYTYHYDWIFYFFYLLGSKAIDSKSLAAEVDSLLRVIDLLREKFSKSNLNDKEVIQNLFHALVEIPQLSFRKLEKAFNLFSFVNFGEPDSALEFVTKFILIRGEKDLTGENARAFFKAHVNGPIIELYSQNWIPIESEFSTYETLKYANQIKALRRFHHAMCPSVFPMAKFNSPGRISGPARNSVNNGFAKVYGNRTAYSFTIPNKADLAILLQNCSLYVQDLASRIKKGELSEDDVQRMNAISNKLKSSALAHKNLPDLLKYWEKIGWVTPENVDLVYPIIYGESAFPVKKGVPYVGDNFSKRTLKRIHLHPKVQEILGAEEDANQMVYLQAAKQNPHPYTWIRELIKNSNEAGATEVNLNVMMDSADKLVFEFQDNGQGVAKDQMHAFFIPGLSTKNAEKNDINFGWGFFTLFKFCDEIVVETTTDGKTKNVLILKKSGNEFHLAEKIEPIKNDQFKGTKISGRNSGPSEKYAFSKVKTNYMRMAQGFSRLTKKFNGEKLEERSGEYLRKSEPIDEFKLSVDKTKGGELVQVYQLPQGGIYYRGLLQRPISLASHFKNLPQPVKEYLGRLRDPLAVNFEGDLKENSSRTIFHFDSLIQPEITRALEQSALLALARQSASYPDFLGFSYDLFRDFNPDVEMPIIAAHEQLESKEPGSPVHQITSPELLRNYVAGLPLYPKGPSLLDVRRKVAKYLADRRILNEKGEFQMGATLDSKDFIVELGDPKAMPLIEHFKKATDEQLKSMKRLAERKKENGGNQVEVQESKVPKVQTVPTSDTDGNYEEFPVTRIPERYQPESEYIEKMYDFLQWQVKKHLGQTVEVQFYEAVDTSHANATPGGDHMAVNMFGSSYRLFKGMVDRREFDPSIYSKIIGTVTHEMVHLKEKQTDQTHNERFAREHASLMEDFELSQNDVAEMQSYFLYGRVPAPVVGQERDSPEPEQKGLEPDWPSGHFVIQ